MIKSKTWVKDKSFVYSPGDIVKLVRKKKNGHPRALELGQNYKVMKTENEDLFVENPRFLGMGSVDYVKVNKNYFAPIDIIRDDIIYQILN